MTRIVGSAVSIASLSLSAGKFANDEIGPEEYGHSGKHAGEDQRVVGKIDGDLAYQEILGSRRH